MCPAYPQGITITSSDTSFARDIFLAVHEGLPRQAPGSDECTRRALRMTGLSGAIDVLDIGCGPGLHTLHLARALPQARLTGTDAHQPYLDELTAGAHALGVTDRLQIRRADMKALPFPDAAFDLLWCEAAVYIMGFEAALAAWRRLLRPGGCLAVSDLVWLRDERPAVVAEFWQAYPDMTNLESRRRQIVDRGYEHLGDFVLPVSAWMDEYYTPMRHNIARLRSRYPGNPQAAAVLDAEETEIRILEQSEGSYGYVFFVLRVPPVS